MNSSFNDEDAPLDPAVEKVRRKVMRLMGISVAIMMIGLMAVIGAIFYKISVSGSKKTVVASEGDHRVVVTETGEIKSIDVINSNITGTIKLPAGARLTNTEFSNNRILLTIKSEENELFLWIYDLAANRVFSRITIEN
ncbi:MAG: hypothetical protein GY761_11265 [Hyphomicrobiales bacterium]|nr:hypothetical protein [Hyphomicrobiales bacterium]